MDGHSGAVLSAAMVAGLAAGAAVSAVLPPARSPAEFRLRALRPPERRGRTPYTERTDGGWFRGCAAAALAAAVGLLLGWPLGAILGSGAGGAFWWWLGRRGDPRERRRAAAIAADLPTAADLLAAALRAGEHLPRAVDAVSRALGGPLGARLRDAADRLRLGAAPEEAWRGFQEPEESAALGRVLARAERTGAPVADVLDRCAAECRDAVRARMVEAGQRVGVLVVAPLGLCFLPAFVLIGVAPLAAGLVSELSLP